MREVDPSSEGSEVDAMGTSAFEIPLLRRWMTHDG